MKKDKLKKLLIFGLNSINYDSGLVNWLNIDGSRNLTKGSETWITARMLHIYCLAKMANIEITNLDKVIETIENSLANKLFDKVNDGWFSKIDNCRASDRKESYQHAFVLLAYATYATTYNSLIAKEKLDHALKIFLNKFYDKEYGLFSDSFSNDWQNKDTYRGLNANMHAVEALLAVFDITNDYKILKIVERIIDFVIDLLKDNNFLLVEHFSENWQPLKDYNIENKADQFKPYGATIGHSFEWSRLFIQFVYTAKGLISSEKRTNILEKALKLFDKAEKVGWDKGYVYTVDFLGTPIIKERMHWVLCEALNASKAFYLITKEHKYFEIYKKDEKYAEKYLIEKDGSWKHQLDAQNKLSTTIWDGKPDIYHASQTLLLSNFRYSFAKTLKKQTFNILVIGELIVDITISDKGEKRYLGGSPCNVALTLSRLNMPPTLLTTYNPQDELGKFVNEKIDLDDIKIDLQINEQTNRSMVYLDDDFNASYSFVYSSNITPNSFDVDYLSLGSISAFQLENNQSKKFQDFTKKAHQAGVITFFDPNIRKEINPPYEISKEIFNSYLPYIDYLKASNEDIDFLYPNTDYFKVAINLFSLGIKLFILTKGESGAILYYQENKQVKSIALSCVLSKVIDTIGAGDSFMGAFIYYIIKYKPQQNEKELKELLLFCLKVASITVSREGANPPYLCELNDKTECSVLTKQ